MKIFDRTGIEVYNGDVVEFGAGRKGIASVSGADAYVQTTEIDMVNIEDIGEFLIVGNVYDSPGLFQLPEGNAN